MALRALIPSPAFQRSSDRTRVFWRLLMVLFAPYRPEKHYMRGPGPKWHEKNRGTSVRSRAAPNAPPMGAGGAPGA